MIPLASLYLHVPFCPHICPYCDFHKMKRNEGLVEAYLERLAGEANERYQDFPVQLDTIYFGGGTPSHLSDKELARVTETLHKTWGFPAKLETTLEADPLTFNKERLQFFKELGFNRLSIGLQSTQDHVLKFLGRIHTGKEGLEAVIIALETGFEVSADLITGIDGQDTAKDLHTLAQTGVPHISVYSLTIEPFTPFALRKVQRNEDKEASDYDLTNEILSSYGLERYEVSSHAKRGHESKHNGVYWGGDYFLALGPSASGFVPVFRGGAEEQGREREKSFPPFTFQISGCKIHKHQGLMNSRILQPESKHLTANNSQDLEGEISSSPTLPLRYTNLPIKSWLNGDAPEVTKITPERYVQDVLMTGLRTRRGVDIQRLEGRTGINILTRYKDVISLFIKHELLELKENHLVATAKGLLQLNGIVSRFLDV
jgi:putative oxygen-independent coproporphyrinogen III oxidase